MVIIPWLNHGKLCRSCALTMMNHRFAKWNHGWTIIEPCYLHLPRYNSLSSFTIADVAVMKYHQWLAKIWIIFTHTSSRKSAKLFSRKFRHAIYALNSWRNQVCTAYICALALDVHISYSISACYKCMYYWPNFLVNNFPDLPYITGNKSQDFTWSLVTFPYSNICY